MCCISSACPGVRELEPVYITYFCEAPAKALDTRITVFVGLLRIYERMHTQSYKLLRVEVLVLAAAAVTRPPVFKAVMAGECTSAWVREAKGESSRKGALVLMSTTTAGCHIISQDTSTLLTTGRLSGREDALSPREKE